MQSNQYYVSNQAEYESSARNYPRKFPIAVGSAKGSWVEDVDGRRYIDFLNGAGTLALGHNDDAINEAMVDLIRSGAPLHMLDMPTPLKDEFVKTLLSIVPPELASRAKVQFCSPSGTDATDAAIKLCKTATGRGTVIAFSGGYHGMGHGPMALTGNLKAKNRVANIMPGVQFMPYPYSYRCPMGIGGEAGTRACINYLERLLKDPESGVTKPAAVILEAVQGEGGVYPATQEFMEGLRRLCDERGLLLLLDEVQTGWGRTGSPMAYMGYHVKPDAVSMAKALGGGMPIGACCATKEVAQSFTMGTHGSTYGGHAVSCAAALASVSEILEKDLSGNARKVGRYLRQELAKLPYVKEARGKGLLVGCEYEIPIAVEVKHKVLERRALITAIGDRVNRMIPPLTVTKKEVDQLIRIMKASILEAAEEYQDMKMAG